MEQAALTAKMRARERMREDDISNLRAKLVRLESNPPPSPFRSSASDVEDGAVFTEMEVNHLPSLFLNNRIVKDIRVSLRFL